MQSRIIGVMSSGDAEVWKVLPIPKKQQQQQQQQQHNNKTTHPASHFLSLHTRCQW